MLLLQMSALIISALYALIYLCMHCQAQEFPYISFNGTTLANHSYLDLTLVGNMESNRVSCHTNLHSCCSGGQGPHRGDWYFPNGSRLPFNSSDRYAIAEIRRAQRVDLLRINNGNVSGIYHCNITTDIISELNYVTEFLHIGLYTSGGDVTTQEELHLQYANSDAVNPKFTLSCSSTGGPATTVTWTRDSEIVSDGTSTVLEDAVTAEYTHTLTVTGRLGGYYQCIVSNNKPSNTSSHFTVQVASPPDDITLTQHGPMNITVSWTPPTPLHYTNGFRVYYRPEHSTSWNTITINDASITALNLTGLTSGKYYNFSIVSLSEHFPSERREKDFYLALLPKKPTVSVSDRSATTLLLSIDSLPDQNYQMCVIWENSNPCSPSNSSDCTITTIASSEYLIAGLDEGSSYTIIVSVTNTAGYNISDPVRTMTLETAPSAPPHNIHILHTTIFTITVGWDEVPCIHRNAIITGYTIVYNVKYSDIFYDISVSGTNVTISDLQSDTEYYIGVAAVNGEGVGPYGTITALTLTFEVMVLSITSNTIDLTWSEAGSIGHDIEVTWKRSNLSHCPYMEENIYTVIVNQQSVIMFGLDEYTSYIVTVTVRNFNDDVVAVTKEAAPSSAPNYLSFISSTASSITIRWEEVPCVHRNGIITGYMIGWKKDDERDFVVYKRINGYQREAEITGLELSRQYEIQVAAVNSAGIGPFTNTSLIANTSEDDGEQQESSIAGGVIAGVIISLLLAVAGVTAVITIVWLWRRQSRKHCKTGKSTPPATYEEVGVTREVKRSHDIQLTSNEAYGQVNL